MHIISVTQQGERRWKAECRCGWSAAGYLSEEVAWGVGLAHKQVNGPKDPASNDDPHVGF